MNIIGKYDASSVDLEGTMDALLELSRAIREPVATQELSLTLPSTPPAPYLGYIKALKIEQGTGKVRLSRVGDQVVITGSPEMLAILARGVDYLALSQSQPTATNYKDHIHIEHHPGHYYLNEGSLPLVLTKRTW